MIFTVCLKNTMNALPAFKIWGNVMLMVAFVLSLAMFFFQWIFRKRTTKRIFQRIALSYMIFFGSLSLGIGGFYAYNADLSSIVKAVIFPKSAQIHAFKSTNLINKPNSIYQIKAPVIHQYPELPRGCEVTSLAMLLQFHNIKVTKMELAEKVKKDETPYLNKDGVIHFGDPNNGFVGDMYNINNPGYGVYHEPIHQLAKEYVGERAVDLTGNQFNSVIELISKGEPVLVITNITYKPLPESDFTSWQTPHGPIDITMKLHAVLVTGFDKESIYFNDPYNGTQKSAPKQEFVSAWEQMGKQAIAIK